MSSLLNVAMVEVDEQRSDPDHEPASAPRRELIFFPDYRQTNHYQDLLVSAFVDDWAVRPGSIDDALGAVLSASSADRVVFHLHWPEPVFAGAKGADDMRLYGFRFLEKLRAFNAAGGSFVWTVHNKAPHDRTSQAHFAWFYGKLAQAADAIHVHSDYARGVIAEELGVAKEKCIVLPHGNFVDVYPNVASRAAARSALGLSETEFVVAAVGQLRPYKGLDGLLSAYRRVRGDWPELKLLFAGKPVWPVKPGYWSGIARVTEGLHVVEGYIPDDEIQTYLNAADVVALPYTDILTSGSALLAASFGKPVIVPNLPALQDVIEAGFALTYEPGDPNGLFSALADLQQAKPSTLKSLADAARAFSDARDWGSISGDYRALAETRLTGERSPVIVDGKEVIVLNPGKAVGPDTVGVAVVSHRSLGDVLELVAEFEANAPAAAYKFYLLDNSGDDWTARQLARRAVGSCVVYATENDGYAAANNVLMSLMRDEGCRYVCILNPDMRIQRGTIDALIAQAEATPRAVLSPLVLNSDGLVTFGGAAALRREDIQIAHKLVGEQVFRVDGKPFETELLHGCSIFFEASLLDVIGPIPEQYFMYYEESDWCLSMERLGVARMIVPAARAVHLKASHGDRVPKLYYLYYLLRNDLIFNARHGGGKLAAEKRLRLGFVADWRAKIETRQAGFLPIFDRCVEIALADGHAGLTGRVDLSQKLDEAHYDRSSTSAGNVEVVEGGFVKGWSSSETGDVWSSSPVWLCVDGLPVSLHQAAVERPDVETAGFGRTTGFSLKIPDDVCDGIERTIEIRSAADGRRLPFVNDESQPLAIRIALPSILSTGVDVQGRVDGISVGAIQGWALDRANPGREVVIEILVDGETVGTAVADTYRADLARAGIGKGTHSFRIALPTRYLAKPAVKVAIRRAGAAAGTKALAEKEVRIDLKSNGFDPNFSYEKFLQWAFLEDEMPVGAYNHAVNVQRHLKLNRIRLAEGAAKRGRGPLVSVVMPAFNRSTVIEEAVRSVFAQIYENFELLVVDDGSVDDTVDVVKALAAELGDRLKLIEHGTNRGVSTARNTALDAARGEFVAYLDSDNVWYDDCLAILIDALLRAPGEAECVYSGQEIWEHLPHFGEADLRRIRACPFNRSKMERRNFIDLNVFLHRRSCVEKYGKFNESMRRLVDWELIIRYTKQKPPVFVPALLGGYYMHRAGNQISVMEDYRVDRQRVHMLHGCK